MKIINFFALALCFFLVSCNNRTVTRMDPNQTVDLSGNWNSTDAKMVSAEMVSSCLNRPWLDAFTSAMSRRPVVIVGWVENRTAEHIETEVFMKEMEAAFINTGTVRVVQASEAREKLRAERADQQTFSSLETRKAWGKELGADFILGGVISSVTDQFKRERTIFYKVNLELTNLETNEKVWIGDKEIKKFVKN